LPRVSYFARDEIILRNMSNNPMRRWQLRWWIADPSHRSPHI